MRRRRGAGRLAAVAALLIATVVAVVLVLRGGGEDYRVTFRFQNASQLVKGNLVQISGRPVGKVEDIRLADDGQAEVEARIDGDYAPLRRGTLATVRQPSLSSVAGRYIDLQMAPQSSPEVEDGGVIEATDTTSTVDLDQLFNTLDPKTRRSLQSVIQGSARQYRGEGDRANKGWAYLNPSLAASARLFRELNQDEALLEDFVVSSSRLVTDIADRRDDLAGLVDNLATTLGAIGAEKESLAEAIDRLPDFMRRSNTTFVNLRATLDDLDPLVEESKPAARALRPFLGELRPLARDARPTLRDLSRAIRSPGASNDLIEAAESVLPARDATTRRVRDRGKERASLFASSRRSFRGSTPQLSFLRPYSVDLLGWFDDFSHSGLYDALGAASRAAPHFNAFSIAQSPSGALLQFVPPELRGALSTNVIARGQNKRCPGAAEHEQPDGSNPWRPSEDYNCDPAQVLPGD